MIPRISSRTAVLGLGWATLGCYQYSPVVETPAPVGSYVLALLSTEGQVALRNRIGMDARELQGELVETTDESLLLLVKTGEIQGMVGGALFQRIDVPRRDILRIDVREFDGVRTGVLLGAGAGTLALLTLRILEGGNPGQTPDNGPSGPEESRRRFLGVSVYVP